MNLKTLTTSIAAAVCVVSLNNAHAVVIANSIITNTVVFSAVSLGQTSATTNGSLETFTERTGTANNTSLLEELAGVLGTNNISKSSKLVFITGDVTPFFAIVGGPTSFDLSSNGTNIMNIALPSDVQILSGTKNDSTGQKNITQTMPLTVTFDDTTITHGRLQFTVTGNVTFTEVKTPISGGFSDSVKGKASNMTGTGAFSGAPFVATATLSFSGKGDVSN